jgi:hypothetical protein
LRQVDFDGQSSLSKTISVIIITANGSGLSNFKRQGHTSYMFESVETLDIVFYVLDNAGRLVYKQVINPEELIDLSVLHSGIYFYHAKQGIMQQSGKVFIN